MKSIPALFAVFSTLAGCSAGGHTGTTAAPVEPAAVTVRVVNNKFDPATVTVKPGQIVEWVFQQGTHDVVSGRKGSDGACAADGVFKSELQSTGTFRHKFGAAGQHSYFCTPHCEMDMVGTVIVAP